MAHGIGGLTGKERKIHFRERASKHFMDDLIAEYFDPEDDGLARARFIPVRGRSEFLPSAGFPGEDPAEPTGEQLEFPLAVREETAARSAPPRETTRADANEPANAEDCTPSAPTGRHSHNVRVVGTPAAGSSDSGAGERRGATARIPAEWFQDRGRVRRKAPFSWRRFAMGCAMGSAAAVLALVVAYVAIT